MARASIRIKKGDVVYVLSGKEKGKTGKVLAINHDKQRAEVEKLMVFKRHYNLALLDPESKKPTRIGTKVLENGKRVRIAKRSGAQIDQA